MPLSLVLDIVCSDLLKGALGWSGASPLQRERVCLLIPIERRALDGFNLVFVKSIPEDF
jgi:hypothetical protein